MVNQRKTHHLFSPQRLQQHVGLISVEGVVDHLHGDVVDGGVGDEVGHRTVGLGVYFVLRVGHLLPPVAAHKKAREYQAKTQTKSSSVTAIALFMGLITHNVKRGLV
jgi:hypothetical protein